ncbi:DUF3040 domain-containing protein [Amycolatopsis sp. GM8]|uniref:DUF3040 domain-containing protein n=1 Tax=Amycolatopsis sp. GM8 TaxID=2896530 RepID=UPI001F243798|nr:DUF3040 domain-containing protein [Amycolatopsis sp. GM8]
MTLSEEYQRRLAAIERELAATSPRLARRFARFPLMITAMLVAGLASAVTLFAAAVTLMVIGINVGAAAPIAEGAVVTALLPLMIGWRWWRHGAPWSRRR